MTIQVEVNEISDESWSGKDGKQRQAKRLVCVDKDPNAKTRFKGDFVVSVPEDQFNFVGQFVKRDMRLSVEIGSYRVFTNNVVFDGRIVEDSIPEAKQVRETARKQG